MKKVKELIDIINICNNLTDEVVLSFILLSDTIFEINSIKFCIYSLENEINFNQRPETLFRRNSISSKSITIFFKLYGSNFIINKFSNIIKEICDNDINLEIDPFRNNKNNDEIIQNNVNIIMDYTIRFFNILYHSLNDIPIQFIHILNEMRIKSEKKFKGFFFLK
jgi:hypothetical protein